MRRPCLRATVIVIGALVLLPAIPAHAAFPLDPTARSSGAAASPASSVVDDGDDEAAPDDPVTDDESDDAYDDDSFADDGSSDADPEDADTGDDADSGAAPGDGNVRSGSSSGTKAGGSSARSGSRTATLKAPRSVQARLTAFNRVVVSWKPGSSVKLTRWVVTLRAGRTGRLLYLGRLARSATFTALKPGVRYSATVTATARGARNASASAAIRTPSLKKAKRAVAQEQARVELAVRLAKARRFG